MMKTFRKIAILCVVLAGLAACASKDSWERWGPSPSENEMFRAMDADGNGFVSREEFAAFRQRSQTQQQP